MEFFFFFWKDILQLNNFHDVRRQYNTLNTLYFYPSLFSFLLKLNIVLCWLKSVKLIGSQKSVVLPCSITIKSITHLSALTYSSSIGTQGTFPSRTPVIMSLNCRPRFSPVMVSLVPPCRGPVSGNSCQMRKIGILVCLEMEQEI